MEVGEGVQFLTLSSSDIYIGVKWAPLGIGINTSMYWGTLMYEWVFLPHVQLWSWSPATLHLCTFHYENRRELNFSCNWKNPHASRQVWRCDLYSASVMPEAEILSGAPSIYYNAWSQDCPRLPKEWATLNKTLTQDKEIIKNLPSSMNHREKRQLFHCFLLRAMTKHTCFLWLVLQQVPVILQESNN